LSFYASQAADIILCALNSPRVRRCQWQSDRSSQILTRGVAPRPTVHAHVRYGSPNNAHAQSLRRQSVHGFLSNSFFTYALTKSTESGLDYRSMSENDLRRIMCIEDLLGGGATRVSRTA